MIKIMVLFAVLMAVASMFDFIASRAKRVLKGNRMLFINPENGQYERRF